MNRSTVVAAVVAALLVLPAGSGRTEEKKAEPAKTAPSAFNRIKALAGTWQCVGKGMEETTTSFEVLANGSAVMERLIPGPNGVMINMYHPDGDAVVITHYCMAGNQPRLRCEKDGSSLAFALSDISNWKKGETRMSAVTLELVDADRMKQTWTSEDGGKSEAFTFEFVRKK